MKGTAKTNEKPNIPITGSRTSPCEALIKREATIGPVHENDTNVMASAIKKAPIYPPLSACLSILLVKPEGSIISNIPKKDAERIINIIKNNKLGIQ